MHTQEIMSLCPQLCLLAFRALFENKRAPKRGRNANFQKSLKVPHNGVIKTLCVKKKVCEWYLWEKNVHRKWLNMIIMGRGANSSQNPPHPSDFGHFEIRFFRGRIFLYARDLAGHSIRRRGPQVARGPVCGHPWFTRNTFYKGKLFMNIFSTSDVWRFSLRFAM